jgi:hypothetical protein
MMIDAIAKRQAAAKVTTIRDHIRFPPGPLSVRWSYAPLAHSALSVRTDLLRGNEVISQCKNTMEQMNANQGGAQYEISIDGVPRTYRDRQDIALQTARLLQSRNPNSVVKMKDLQTGEETVVTFKSGQ